MRNTPIHINGPFKLALTQGHWVISGRDGVSIVELTAKLVDGSDRTEKYPDGFIRTEEARAEEALFVLEAMNLLYERGRTSPYSNADSLDGPLIKMFRED